MGENKGAAANTGCPGNYTCENDKAGGTIDPAQSTGCYLVNAGKQSADATVSKGTPMKAQQMQDLHRAIVDDAARRRLEPKYTTIDAKAGSVASFDGTMKRIKENIQRLTGYELAVNKGDLMRAADIQTAYQKLNTSEDLCVCVERCTCNARANANAGSGSETLPVSGNVGGPCQCNTRVATTCTCESRCTCYNKCNCDGDCNCAGRTHWGTCCTCNNRCGCDSRGCECVAQYAAGCQCLAATDVQCAVRCGCNARTSVNCACNIRNVCPKFVAN